MQSFKKEKYAVPSIIDKLSGEELTDSLLALINQNDLINKRLKDIIVNLVVTENDSMLITSKIQKTINTFYYLFSINHSMIQLKDKVYHAINKDL